jgi:hypothetical protein
VVVVGLETLSRQTHNRMALLVDLEAAAHTFLGLHQEVPVTQEGILQSRVMLVRAATTRTVEAAAVLVLSEILVRSVQAGQEVQVYRQVCPVLRSVMAAAVAVAGMLEGPGPAVLAAVEQVALRQQLEPPTRAVEAAVKMAILRPIVERAGQASSLFRTHQLLPI